MEKLSKQYVEGQTAWSFDVPRSKNPYDQNKQPVYWGRWNNGWTESFRLATGYYRHPPNRLYWRA